MDSVLICSGGTWVQQGQNWNCTGTLQSILTSDLGTTLGLMTQETFEAFYPWALLMLGVAFGIKLIRKAIYSKG